MVLVDTSVIIDFLKNRKTLRASMLDELIERKWPWGINEHIYQEILQGARNQAEFEQLKEYFETIPIYKLLLGKASFEKAALLNLKCRSAGVTVRSTIDLIIAETAIENDLALLHDDSTFEKIGRVIKELREYHRNIL